MHRDTNGASLVGDRARDRLTNPPGGIRTELIALGVIELLHSTNQADIPLLDQVQQAHATANIFFRHAHNQAQVRLCQTTLTLFTVFDNAIVSARRGFEQLSPATLHTLSQTDLFFRRKQRHAPDLAQVHAYRIIQAALKVRNYDSEAIIPFILGNLYIFRSRLPVYGWLFGWVQGIHSFFVL